MLEEIVEKVETPEEITDFERANDLPPISKITREQALTEIAKTRANKGHPYNSSGHWHRQRALERMDKLYQLAYPEPTKEDKERELAQIEKQSQERKEGFQAEVAEKKRLEAEKKIKDEIENDPELAAKKIDYPTAVKIAREVLQSRSVSDEDLDFLDESGRGNDPALIKALLTIGLVDREAREWKKNRRSRS